MLADVPNVLTPRGTNVYWWQTTKEFKPDWDTLNVPISGTLEIANQSVGMTPYSLQFNGGYDGRAKTSLVTGDTANAAFAANQRALAGL